MDDYRDFLDGKQRQVEPSGFDVAGSELPDKLFPFQRDIVRWALKRGRAAIFADCGLGKTAMQLAWAEQVCRKTGGQVLILAPLAVAAQTKAEGAKFGIGVQVCRDQFDTGRGSICVTNYQKLQHFDPKAFDGVVLDECFAPGTLVDFAEGPFSGFASTSESYQVSKKRIEDIRCGDKIINAWGVDPVSNVHLREVPYAIKVHIGTPVVVSPNHPFFTQRGWIGAQDLEPGDAVLQTTAAMRMVRSAVYPEGTSLSTGQILRSILLSEVADASTGTLGQGSQSGSGGQARSREIQVVSLGERGCQEGAGTDRGTEPNDRSGRAVEGCVPIESDEPQTFRAWGEWTRADCSPGDTAGCTWTCLGGGVAFVVGPANSGLSHKLQARLGKRRAKSVYRGGWSLPLLAAGSGPEEGREGDFARVDGIEVLEQGHIELEQLRAADGKLYFYDLGATRHPSFSVNGCLVHNSSILKSYMGKTKRQLLEAFASTPFRLACTATPAPNDHMELGNHSEFLGVMPSNEMLARWFIADQADCGHYRLKGHAAADYWSWVSSWALCVSRPSDLGYSDDGFTLPPLEYVQHIAASELTAGKDGLLFESDRLNATSLHREMRKSAAARAEIVAGLVDHSAEAWVVWCNTNYEADELAKRLPYAVEIRGNESEAVKEAKLAGFANGTHRVMVTKPSIAGFGLNWQHCHNVAFVGLSYSFEQFYQAIRRTWRFGQSHLVTAHMVLADGEGDVLRTVQAKMREFETMRTELVAATQRAIGSDEGDRSLLSVDQRTETGDGWTMHLGDCVEVTKKLPAESVGLTVFSPPFAGLYIYSDARADMGNSASDDEFFAHFSFLVPELYRVTIPGRLCVVHCKDLPRYAGRDGTAGLKDFPGHIIRMFESYGWSFHSRVTIWKCPVVERERTNNNGLLHKTLKRDSSQVRQGMADFLIVFRRPPAEGLLSDRPIVRPDIADSEGNIVKRGGLEVYHGDSDPRQSDYHPSPYARKPSADPALALWQRYAEPVWWDIDQMDVLNYQLGKADRDEKHICPLQLGCIKRAVELWSEPGDLVLSPFAGIGSEGHCSLGLCRQFVGIELKDSYWRIACRNLRAAEEAARQKTLFSEAG